MAANETNRLTMKLLAIVCQCSGPEAGKIRDIVLPLANAVDSERQEAQDIIQSLTQENQNLTQTCEQLSITVAEMGDKAAAAARQSSTAPEKPSIQALRESSRPSSPSTIPNDAVQREVGRLYIGNLPLSATEGELREFLRGYGCQSMEVIDVGRLRPSHALVTVSNTSDAKRAVSDLDQRVLRGRRLKIDLDQTTGQDDRGTGRSGKNGAGDIAVKGRADVNTPPREHGQGLGTRDLFYERGVKRARDASS